MTRLARCSTISYSIVFAVFGFCFTCCCRPNPSLAQDAAPQVLLDSVDAFESRIEVDTGTSDTLEGVIRLNSVADPENAWDVQLESLPIATAIRKGDLLEFSFEGRSADPTQNDGLAFANVYFVTKEPVQAINTEEPSTPVTLHPEWRQFHCVARADRDFEAGSVVMTMHCSIAKQSLEVRAPRLLYWANALDESIPATLIQYDGQEDTADWRTEAQQRIRELRTTPLTIAVHDSEGKPVVGAKVRVKQRTHSYAFGSFTDSMPLKTGVDAERYRKTMRQYFNRVTLPRYFADWGTDTPEGQIAADNMASWAASEGYQLKSHILLSPSYLPSRVTALQNDPEVFRQEIESAMEDSLKRTAKLPMYAWDALSELRESKIVSDTLGESYYASVFNRGYVSQPNAKWYINESDVLELTSEQNANIDLYESMIRKVLDDGGKISGIGFQGHFSDSVTPIPKVLAILDRFAKFGIPLEITEFDINTRDEAGQAEYTRDFLTAVFSHPATEGFTCWGFWEGSMWRPSAAMIRKDWSTKPNGKVWTDLIKKQWWTNEEGITDNNGQVIIRAFHGRHSLEIESDTDFFSKDIMVDKGTADLSISLPGS